MIYHRKVLKNGLRIITVPMPSVESATALVMVGAGSRYETKKNNGISHFLEHMAFKGTKKRPTAHKIASAIDGVGGEFNAFTEREYTGYIVKAPVAHLNLSLDVLSDMLQNSLLDKAEIEREKGVIIQELNLYEDTPSRNILDVYPRLLYGDTPMGRDVGGEKEIIRKITREDFMNYLKSLYSSDNISVVVAGGIKTSEVEKMVEGYFSKMKPFGTKSYEKIEEKQIKPHLSIKQKDTEQVNIAVGFRTVPVNHDDRYALEILASVLGGGMSSRLFSEIRERRGLAYSVYTSSEHYQDAGTLYTVAGLDKNKVDDGIAVILEEYAKFAKGKSNLTQKELNRAREFLKGHLILRLEDSRTVAWYYGLVETLEDKIETPQELIAKIDKLTVSDIENVAKKYFKKGTLNLAIIGDFNPSTSSGRFEKLLKS
ncbi:MAG: peptidase M16 protein [uncultured bacterium]|nr:MAG: peptidase M16 protein [uncultured bacterium]